MKKRYGIVFLLLTIYALLAPGAGAGNDPYLASLATGRFEEVDPLVTAVFSMLGVYPLLFAALLLPKDQYRLPAWPFVLASFVTGAFAILPYLFLRGKKAREVPRGPGFLQRAFSSRLYLLLILLLSLAAYIAAGNGSGSAYAEAYTASSLVSVMSVDFLVVIWLARDILRTDWQPPRLWASWIPGIGPALVLLGRSIAPADKSD
ncbi:hypothetical protein [Alkalicoccus urumqiensis]|uniref:DUF2834 domain-containing protein n=1 Tax=Alkalicoccus urumqiensis TaxID=1548213 RepID=A0A2P6MDM2_ALKUR|nr:hypothetical protein [Alkalicoccus urumqiensis]PRO64376.1 hypothetical protein C6I21_14860 [Alkalicoccus urumqiensis]